MSADDLSLNTVLSPALTHCGMAGASKKRTLELISESISVQHKHLDATAIFNKLISRERLGSTGFGNGIAIPHCRLEGCNQAIGVLCRLADGVDFEAVDRHPVDLIFTLVVPVDATDEHLQLLSQIAERFSNDDYCKRLRRCRSDLELYESAVS